MANTLDFFCSFNFEYFLIIFFWVVRLTSYGKSLELKNTLEKNV